MEGKEIWIDGKKLFYRAAGYGPVVILLHGFGVDGTLWKNQFQAFPGFSQVIPDLPGSGQSEITQDMSIEGMADTMMALLKRLEITRCWVIGHSMGGYITLAIAEKAPELLFGWGLFHSTAYADGASKIDARKKGIDFIQQHGPYVFLKNSIPPLFSPANRDHNSHWVSEQIDASRNFSASSLVSYYMSMIKRPDRTHVLSTTSLPVLFILGKYDTAVPLEDGLRLCYLPDLSYIHILENSAHMGMIEEADISNTIINEYLISTSHPTQ